MRPWITLALAGALAAAAAALAGTAIQEVTQHDRKFSVAVLRVRKGEAVSFRNLDPFFHNIFSVTPGSEFDLGGFPQGEAKSVTFDHTGTVDVECALHPEMRMKIEVHD